MNTSGYIRGYMAKNMKAEEFIKLVIRALSREFEVEVLLLNITDKDFLIKMDNYRVIMTMELIHELKSPYGIDRYILEEFEKQGFDLDKNRSQYVQYCFGSYLED